MKLGSLFDGSGTCPLAASAVGIIPAWASEDVGKWHLLGQSHYVNDGHKNGMNTRLLGILLHIILHISTFNHMLYIMEGVQEVLAERYLDNLFGGDTAEP